MKRVLSLLGVSTLVLIPVLVPISPRFRISAMDSQTQASLARRPQPTRETSDAAQVAAAEERAHLRGQSISTKRWLLQPDVYSQISSGGQIGVRVVNGLYRQPPSTRPPKISERGQAPQAISAGQNIRVSDPAQDVFGHTQSETSVTVNGPNIVESFNDSADVNLYGLSSYAISTDGGMTFSHQHVPLADAELNLGDGVAAFGPNGELYYSEIAVGVDGIFIGVWRAADGINFETLANASTTALNATDFQDKPWMVVDKSPSSRFKGNVYVSWTDFTAKQGTFINVATSANTARSFRKPVTISPKGRGLPGVQGSIPAVAPNGDLYVSYLDGGLSPGGISIVKSTDGGATFTSPKPVAVFNPIGPMTGMESVRTNSFPSMSIDGSGNIHIVFDAEPVVAGPDRSDIYYVNSTDGGNTFSTPIRINDDNTMTSQFFPSVAATSNGTVGIKWWDRRNDPINDVLTDVYMSISPNGGASFGPNFRITDHNWFFGPVEQQLASGYHGDYDGITTDGANFYLSWSDERGRDPDAYFTFIPTNQNPVRPDFNISATRVYDITSTGSQQFNLTTSATGGFSGNLSLTAAPVDQDGASQQVSFSNTTIAAGAMATITVTTPQFETVLLTVTATSGGISRSTNLRVAFTSNLGALPPPTIATDTSGFSTFNGGLKSDSSGSIHAAFDDDTGVGAGGSHVDYIKSNDGGRTYSQPTVVSANSTVAFNSVLTVDAADNTYIAWTSVGGASGERIFISRSTDHGITFSTPIAVTPQTQLADFARIAAGPTGILICSYIDFSTGVPRLMFVRSSDGGFTFSNPFQISGAGEVVDTLGHSLVADSTGNAFFAYVDDSGTSAVKFAALNRVAVFSRSGPVSDPSVPSFAPDLALDQSGGIDLVYYSVLLTSQGNQNREIMFSKSCNLGGEFSPPLNVSQNLGQSRFPSITVDANGVAYVAWEDTEKNNEQDIFVAIDIGGGTDFSTIGNLSNNPGFSTHASLTTDTHNNVIAVWSDDSTAESDIFSAVMPGYPKVAPAFGLDPLSGLALHRGSRGLLTVFIARVDGFSDTVTVTASDTSALKLLVAPAQQSTSCISVTFTIKAKKGARPGIYFVTFTGTDSKGNTSTVSAGILVQ